MEEFNKPILRNAIIEALAANFEHIPTPDQQNFIEKMAEFLLPESKWDTFILRGYAGTGKTTCISALVKVLPTLKLKYQLLAPTGRAAKVVSNYTQLTAYTIHRHIYSVSDNKGGLHMVLRPNRAKNTLYIVDEASMISGEEDQGVRMNLLQDLIAFVNSGENCALLFIGDIAQLPPVHTTLSPALIPRELRDWHDRSVNGAQLTKVVRQGLDSGILSNATGIREQIDAETTALQLDEKFEDVLRIDGMELQEVLEDAFTSDHADETILITKSNKRAAQFNDGIRKRILYREEQLEAGDRLMIVKNNYFWMPAMQEGGFIANGDVAEVLRISNREERYGFDFADVQLRFEEYQSEPVLEVKVLMNTLLSEKAGLSSSESEQLYESVASDYSHLKSRAQKYLAMKKDPYFQALHVKFAWAITAHKAQGGQWENVIVDQGFLSEESLDQSYLRWLYTAVTRAKKKLFFLNFNEVFFKE